MNSLGPGGWGEKSDWGLRGGPGSPGEQEQSDEPEPREWAEGSGVSPGPGMVAWAELEPRSENSVRD